MRPFVLLALAAGLLGLQMSSAAADKCDNAADQAAMNACAERSLKESDAALNRLYKQIEARLADDSDAKELLVSTQRAWIAFRDAECAFSSSAVTGGSLHPMMVTMCRDGLTQARIKDFQEYLNCEEGDMSCPVPAGE